MTQGGTRPASGPNTRLVTTLFICATRRGNGHISFLTQANASRNRVRTLQHMHDADESLRTNRALWTRNNADYTDGAAREAWLRDEICWGQWDIPERDVRALPSDLAGLDVIELGCGTAYWSAWLARRGARPVGVDPTPAQLATARRCQRELGIAFPLIEAAAESVPLPDASFDLAVSEYGASIWADPDLWLAEASRLLRPGGRLVFLRNSTLSLLCSTDEGKTLETLVQPQFGHGYRYDWRAFGDGIEFQPTHGEWIRLLRKNAFEVLDLIELQAPSTATDHPFYANTPAVWAQRWPAEEIWIAARR